MHLTCGCGAEPVRELVKRPLDSWAAGGYLRFMGHDSKPPRPTMNLSGKRRSASAEASRDEELERIRRMTPLQRMALALSLGRRHRDLVAARAGTANEQ